MTEREVPGRIDEILEGFIVHPWHDDGPYFLKTEGLSGDDLKAICDAVEETRVTGYLNKFWALLPRYKGRLVYFADLISKFESPDPIRIRVLIEKLEDPNSLE